MATIDLSNPPPTPVGILGALPRRVSLTLAELQCVACRAGGAPLPFEMLTSGGERELGGRLGRTPATLEAEAYDAAISSLHDPQSSLARRGLLVDTSMDEGLLGAVGLLATPTVALDLDVAAGDSRVKAFHRQHGRAVASLATADGIVFELAWFSTDQWADELARVTVLPEDLTLRGSVVPDQVVLPYGLADAASEAVRSNRSDLLPVLVAEHSGETRYADGRVLPDLEVVTLLSGLSTESRGRLRALVADVSGATTSVVGVVSWVLLADGWRTLRPRRTDGVDRVELSRVGPADLARELAPVLAEVTT
jgi:hypothetical protein